MEEFAHEFQVNVVELPYFKDENHTEGCAIVETIEMGVCGNKVDPKIAKDKYNYISVKAIHISAEGLPCLIAQKKVDYFKLAKA